MSIHRPLAFRLHLLQNQRAVARPQRWEAFQLMSQVCKLRVGNVVDPMYTVVAKFPKRYLP